MRIGGSTTSSSRQEPSMTHKAISPLRHRMIEDMTVRQFCEKAKHDYIRHVEIFAMFLGRSPDNSHGEDLRRFQVHQTENGVKPPKMNTRSVGTALFFLDHARPPRSRPPARPASTIRGSCRASSAPKMWPACLRRRLAQASSTRPRLAWLMAPACAAAEVVDAAHQRYRQQAHADPRRAGQGQ